MRVRDLMNILTSSLLTSYLASFEKMRTRLGFENVALHFKDVVGLFLVTS